MKDFLTYLVLQLVEHQDDVSVEEIDNGGGSFQYTIHVNSQDIGKIIGKEGKIIQAIRNLVKVLAVKNGIQVRIEIAENLPKT